MHELRFFSADGKPTLLVRDRGQTSYDRPPATEPHRMVAPSGEAPPPQVATASVATCKMSSAAAPGSLEPPHVAAPPESPAMVPTAGPAGAGGSEAIADFRRGQLEVRRALPVLVIHPTTPSGHPSQNRCSVPSRWRTSPCSVCWRSVHLGCYCSTFDSVRPVRPIHPRYGPPRRLPFRRPRPRRHPTRRNPALTPLRRRWCRTGRPGTGRPRSPWRHLSRWPHSSQCPIRVGWPRIVDAAPLSRPSCARSAPLGAPRLATTSTKCLFRRPQAVGT